MNKKILWLSTGGTFSCESSENGLTPKSDAEQNNQILTRLPELTAAYDITPRTILNIDSTDMTADEWSLIADEVNRAVVSGEYGGIVITHGTDTMAYTAAALSVMLKSPPLPVILTGSQRPFFAENSDAPKNLTDAVRVASDGRFKGVFAVFCGKILHGLDMYKSDSFADEAFCARDRQAGEISGKEIHLLCPESISNGDYEFCPDMCREVAVLKMTPAFDPKLIDVLVRNGIKGIVAEGYGTGGIPRAVRVRLAAAAQNGIAVTVVSQCLHGGVDLGVYAVGESARAAGITGGKKYGAEAALAVLMHRLGGYDDI